MFGVEELTTKTIKEVKESGGKIQLYFRGEEIICEVIL